MASASAIKLPTWYRVLAVIVGVFSIALALIVLVEPLLAVWLLIFFLAFALLLIGIDRLAAGISGHPFGQMMGFIPPMTVPGDQSKSPAPPSGPTPPKT